MSLPGIKVLIEMLLSKILGRLGKDNTSRRLCIGAFAINNCTNGKTWAITRIFVCKKPHKAMANRKYQTRYPVYSMHRRVRTFSTKIRFPASFAVDEDQSYNRHLSNSHIACDFTIPLQGCQRRNTDLDSIGGHSDHGWHRDLTRCCS